MRRYWLIFAQAVTVCLGILFVVTTLRPDLLRLGGPGAAPPAAVAAARLPAGSGVGPVSYADGVARAAPSVVNVYTTKHVNVPLVPLPDDPVLRQLFGQVPGMSRRQATTSLGSGVIVSHDGHVLTNYHVVQAADAIEVALSDGRRDTAKLVGADPDTDLAVLKLSSLRTLPAATLAADRGLRVGDVVLAIGNPFGVGQTTTQGIVSALGRNGLGLNTYESFIQTDAAINPGNSGGALVDAEGNLVGINTAIYSESGGSMGIGFATPIEIARKVMDDIVKTGSVKRGWLGVEPQDVTPELARAFELKNDTRGVIIAGVMRDGPAARAGLRVGDIVQTINGKRMADTTQLLGEIAQLPPGQRAALGVLRAGKAVEVAVVVGTRPGKPR
ncbi:MULTISPECIES: trypsin-like peptidase domain-containing protein [Achromobacter]|uniref:Trypsin-like peptidase domain-containing protein n=1 Tax=Achromobacter spanius TaxID=217203 RepID=A0ABY8GPG7_9BURK|nr:MULTISPECIES: trypsin-like peptidase domain-containing protein [Achromobacter]WAI84025.1 trypsin-like peptidase domain-containing protein [Achromobacter spanius]WEX94107.1 trypsin-like peptidase domain-containing protein [Achromobacter sp. SS2-2022]WFP06731.1 trypsin-like peptidase domain-containing protein [Achromobacter spanius]